MSGAITQFIKIHKREAVTDKQRLGQRFCNMYLKDPKAIPGLFNEADAAKATASIRKWLAANHYENELPRQLKELV